MGLSTACCLMLVPIFFRAKDREAREAQGLFLGLRCLGRLSLDIEVTSCDSVEKDLQVFAAASITGLEGLN